MIRIRMRLCAVQRHRLASTLLLAGFLVVAAAPSGFAAAGVVVLGERPIKGDVADLVRRSVPGNVLELDLLDGASVRIAVTSARRGDVADLVVRGRIAGDPAGRVGWVVNGDVVAGELVSPRLGMYQLRPDGNGGHLLRRLDPGAAEVCAGVLPAPGLPEADSGGGSSVLSGPGPGTPTAAATGSTLIDLMLVYTPSAEAAVGGPAAMQAILEGHVDYCNMAYDQSLAGQQVRLVHSAVVSYAESGNALTDLARLQDPADGFMDEVHVWRDTYGADCVSLIATSGSAGVAFQMINVSPAFENRAFSYIGHDIMSLVLAHELGHNMGCGHNHFPGAPAAAFCYSYGYRTPDNLWRTIMSYAPGTHVDFFSSPGLTWMGWPLGVDGAGCPADGADNVTTLNLTKDTVAAFRPTMVAVDAFVDLGGALAGTPGLPLLTGLGTLEAGSAGSLTLTNGLAGASSVLLLSLTGTPVPFMGGVLQAFPVDVQVALAVLPDGTSTLGWPAWPAGVPAGTTLVFQWGILDSGAVQGVALSNAVNACTP